MNLTAFEKRGENISDDTYSLIIERVMRLFLLCSSQRETSLISYSLNMLSDQRTGRFISGEADVTKPEMMIH